MSGNLVGGITLEDLFRLIEAQQMRRTKLKLHPNGFLQLPLSIGESAHDSRLRFHIWSERIPARGERAFRIHDHIFDMDSYVLYGSLLDKHYDVRENAAGDYVMLQSDGTGQLNRTEKYFSCEARAPRIIKAGSIYPIPQGQFHISEPQEDLVATVIYKPHINHSARSRVIARRDYQKPRVEVNRDIDQELAWEIVRSAQEKIK